MKLLSSVHREGNGTPFQYACLENPMDGGAWWAAMSHRVGHDRSDVAVAAAAVVYDSLRPHGLQPTRLLHP